MGVKYQPMMRKSIKASKDFAITSRNGMGHDESLLYSVDFENCWSAVPTIPSPISQLVDVYNKFAISKIVFVVDTINIHYQMYDAEDLPTLAYGTTIV